MGKSQALQLQDVEHGFRLRGQAVPVLRGVSMELEPGRWSVLRGASGAGKTTLLLIAAGLLRPESGRVLHQGQDLWLQSAASRREARARGVGVVFQGLHLVPWLDALDNVAVALPGGLVAGNRAKALARLGALGLEERAGHRPGELSAGECRRVALARALVNEPALMLADEPTGSLDPTSAQVVLEALQAYVVSGGCLFQSTHEAQPTARVQAEAVLEQGVLLWTAGETAVQSTPVKPMIIAIDGPAASGKSSVARMLAVRLGLPFLNTGAMYRAVGMACEAACADLDDDGVCALVAGEQRFDLDDAGCLTWNGEPAEERVGSEAAGKLASRIALLPKVRDVLVQRQRELAREHGAVAEGRDTTTVVFPMADFKFFLWASPEVRGRRRAMQAGTPEQAAQVAADIAQRDAQDAGRAVAPLMEAEDALRVETDGMDLDAVVEHLAGRVEVLRS